jgi:hypothetical protein
MIKQASAAAPRGMEAISILFAFPFINFGFNRITGTQ